MNRLRTLTPLAGAGTVGEDALRQQSLMLELTPVLMCDGEQKITYWNRSAELLYGFTREEALGQTCHALLQTRFPEPLEGILARVRSGRQWQGELSQVRSDGKRIAVASEWISYLGAGGELEAIIEVNHEITDRKLAEESLARVTARFEGIIASAIDAIISIDAQQKIVLFNPAAAKLFGVPAEEALGQSLSQFIPERFRGAHAHHVEKFGQTGVSTRRMGALGTVSGLRANGQEFPIEASISQVEVGGEKLFTVILRDITERQRAEQDLQEAQAALKTHAETLEKTVAERTAQLRETVAELEAFSYSLSHDMRAPLRAIHTFTHIVLDDYAKTLGADATDLLKKSLAAAQRMDRLIQDVLAFSRVSRQPIELRPVDVERLVLATILERPELQAPGIDIKVDSPLLPIMAHEPSLSQCLTNLLVNAVKFMAPNVQPRVRVWTEEMAATSTHPAPAGSQAGTAAPKPRVRLWVGDNGIGIEREAQAKVFDIFQRLNQKYEGTGIGLAIVKKAAERMGGKVGVESEPGKGSRFWLELPKAGG